MTNKEAFAKLRVEIDQLYIALNKGGLTTAQRKKIRSHIRLLSNERVRIADKLLAESDDDYKGPGGTQKAIIENYLSK